jgi:putative membrane protein
MKMRTVFLVGLVFAAGLVTGCETTTNENSVTANTNTTMNSNAMSQTTPMTSMSPRHDDTAFMNAVAMDGMAEVELGRMAAQKAKDPEVKQFAQRMVADHSKAAAELKQLANNKNVTLPADINSEQKADMDRLSKLTGANFDREYMSLMSAAHDKAVEAFEAETRDGSDSDVKTWATKILPTLKEHQTRASDIAAKVGG